MIRRDLLTFARFGAHDGAVLGHEVGIGPRDRDHLLLVVRGVRGTTEYPVADVILVRREQPSERRRLPGHLIHKLSCSKARHLLNGVISNMPAPMQLFFDAMVVV